MDREECSSLVEALADVPDPRQARGQQYGWRLLMTLIAWAMVAGQRGGHGIADWVQLHRAELINWPGLPYATLPHEATLRRALRQVNIEAMEARLAELSADSEPPMRREGAKPGQPVGQAIDGKALRGAAHHGRPMYLVARVVHGRGKVLDHIAVEEKSNEITAVPRLLAGKSLADTVITMDALLTQRELSKQILDQGGDYLLIAKEDQPRLFTTIALHFDKPPPTRPIRSVTTRGKGHGRLELPPLGSGPSLPGDGNF